MTRVKMLRNFSMSSDGIRVQTLAAGSEHEVADDMLSIMIECGVVEIVDNKAYGAAPENKARKRGRPRKA